MKVCKMGLESIWIDHAEGDVRLCAWTGYRLGKLTDHTIEELWHGEKAELFRQSMLDGSYSFCNCQNCPYLANNTLEEMLVEYEVPEYPRYCSLSYEEQCNYVCVFCRKEPYKVKEGDNEKIIKIENELQKFIGNLDTISSNGVGEVFCSPHILKVLGSINTHKKINVNLESNGSLFTPENWEKISNLGKYNLSVYITLYSFEEATYQFLTGTNRSIQKVIENLHFIQSLRDKNVIDHLEIATVICERNFREIPSFVERCLSEFNFDSIRLRYFIPYNVNDKAIEWFFDIRNPYHPYYKEFVKVMDDPILNNSKVWKWQGNTISNIGVHPFFWERQKADLINKLFAMENLEDKIEKWAEQNSIKSFSLYGFSSVCKSFIVLIGDLRTKLDRIYDKNSGVKGFYRGIEIVLPEKGNLESDVIIVTSIFDTEIKENLKLLNYKGKIMNLNDMLNELECYGQ